MPLIANITTQRFAIFVLLALFQIGLSNVANASSGGRALVAKEFAKALQNKEYAGMDKLIDIDQFCDIVAGRLYDNPIKRQLFKVRECSGFKRGSFAQRMFSGSHSMQYSSKYIGKNVHGDDTIRMVVDEGGFEYLELSFSDDKPSKIIDIYVGSQGRKMSESIAETVGILSADDDSIMQRLTGISEIDKDTLKVFKKLVQLNTKGEFVEAYKRVSDLPEAIQITRLVSVMKTGYASMIDEVTYYKALAQLDELHGNDETLTLMLLDYYFYSEDENKLKQAITKLRGRYKDDASILFLEANINVGAGDVETALTLIDQVLKQEPNFVDAHLTRAYLYLGQDNRSKAKEALADMRKQLGAERADAIITQAPELSAL